MSLQLLHLPWMWKYVHHIHHQFLTPTPFAQDAVHPIEGIVQGPMGHHLITLFVPMHPVAHALFGFLTSVYAIGAHDGMRAFASCKNAARASNDQVVRSRCRARTGRMFDWNDHVKHHSHKHVNYGLYWGFWDYICGTRYNSAVHKPASDPGYN